VAGNVQRQVRAAGLRVEIVQKSRQGMSNEDIAAEMGICTKTVQRHMRRYLETDSKYPVNLGPEVIDLMRSAEWDGLEQMQRFIVQSFVQLQPVTFAERARAAEVAARAGEAYTKLSERKAAMFALNAPTKPESHTTNNNLMLGATDEITFLRDLARYKELQINAQR
jgi:Helix-turn-helix domain